MDVEPDPVAGAVEVPVLAAGGAEHRATRRIDVGGRDAGADGGHPGRLGLADAGVDVELLGRAERSIASLGLAYRIVDLCTGDLGNSSARTFDIEVYAPGCDQWLEVSSVSWFSDYQARRANVRYRPSGGKGTEVVHTLNGSALAVPRVWAALVETYRQPDGSVAIPEVLWPYTRGATQISR